MTHPQVCYYEQLFDQLPGPFKTTRIQCHTCAIPAPASQFRRFMMIRFLHLLSSGGTRPTLATAVLLAILSLSSPCQQTAASASLTGTVRDAQGKPVGEAVVQLQDKDAGVTTTARTDSDGSYKFSAIAAGIYSLRIVINGSVETETSSLVLVPGEAKTFDCMMGKSKPGNFSDSSAAKFFDEPRFTVSGVTDTTNLGGHGSDIAVRTRESLVKDTASLANSTPGPRSAESGDIEKSLRENASRQPASFEANHRLGAFLAEDGRPAEAISYLESAQKSNPADYQNSYDLARACYAISDYDHSRQIVSSLMPAHDTAELHHLLGDLEEKLKDPLEAVRQYQRAAELDPSEPYLFDWGSELLLHSAAEPARDVFLRGTHSFPRSQRMLLALGAAWFALGNDDNAVQQICQASDLDSGNPVPYLFLGKMQRAETIASEAAVDKLRRFVTLQPANPEANYYYAVALWKRRKLPPESSSPARPSPAEIETLLNAAVRLNPQYAAPHLQLGILHSDAGNNSAAINEYEKAIQLDSHLEEAHYRLAQAYRQLGQPDESKEQLRLYQKLSRQSAQQADQERHEIRQFVYTLRDQPQH